jgi:hypothetical protein
MVVYSDSVDCTGYYISQLGLWNELLYLENKSKSKVAFFFIINIQAQDYNIVKSALNLSQLKHSVYIDTIDVFKQNNPQLPDSRIHHTFLLNKENKVVLIGNPLYNERVEKLFLELLKEQL